MAPAIELDRTMMSHVFDALSPSAIVREPFPHVVIEDVLPQELADQLAFEVPPLGAFVRGRRFPDNLKIRRGGVELMADGELAPVWRAMVERHLTRACSAAMLRLFADDIAREHPALAERLGPHEAWHIGVRGRDTHRDHAALVEAQLVYHTPVMGPPCTERGPHVKGATKLIESQLYVRPVGESHLGADLELYAIRPGFAPQFDIGQQTEHEYLRLARTVPYANNVLVAWVNTPRSIFQVSLRGPTPHPYRFFGVLLDLAAPLFELPLRPGPPRPYQWISDGPAAPERESVWRRVRRTLAGPRQ